MEQKNPAINKIAGHIILGTLNFNYGWVLAQSCFAG